MRSLSPAAATLGLCLLAGPALAHAHLKAAVPAADGTVSSPPAEVDLTFSEGVNPKFSGVAISGPDGAKIQTGAAEHGSAGDMTLRISLPQGLAPGHYTVDWHALATDGHKTAGSYGFSIKP